MTTTYAVFMDRCNTTWREADGFATEDEARAEADRRARASGWPHYVAESDFDPGAAMAEMYESTMRQAIDEYMAQGMTREQAEARLYDELYEEDGT
jgi:hypothetical protein